MSSKIAIFEKTSSCSIPFEPLITGGLTLRRGGEASAGGGGGSGGGAAKLITVSVVGLSGGEKEKGSMGIGKSCLCNRLVYDIMLW